jgi:division protein CdvB (Snf7/Vps24/ESCRT-III family)
MPRLQEASHRLQVAIDRLEQVVTTRATQGEKAGAAGDDDRALREALEAARRENAELQQLAGTVSTRLDATIGRLRKLVG